MLLFLALLQSATDLPPIDFDLAKVDTSEAACAGGGGGAIVVCGRRRIRPPDRVTRYPEVAVEALPKAETRLFGQVRGKVGMEGANVGGFTSNRAMVTVAVPF